MNNGVSPVSFLAIISAMLIYSLLDYKQEALLKFKIQWKIYQTWNLIGWVFVLKNGNMCLHFASLLYTDIWNPPSCKTRTYLVYIAKIMGAYVFAKQGATASATVVFTMLNRTLGNKFLWIFKWDSYIFIQENAFENAGWKISAFCIGLNGLSVVNCAW